jgi:hypothetical protein
MPKHNVRVTFPGHWDTEVEAATPEAAIAEAKRRWADAEDDGQYEVNGTEGVTAEIIPA